MPLMTWSEKLSTGIAAMDEEHKQLIALLNELHDAIEDGQGKAILGRILDGLIAYTGTHFAHEESLFAETGYPDALSHKIQHEALIRQVNEIQAKFTATPTAILPGEVLSFLKNWLTTHIQGTDKEYGPHLKSMGIR